MIVRCGRIAAALAILTVYPPDRAGAESRSDFVSGPWVGRAMFDDSNHRFRGCGAFVPSGDDPTLFWIRWHDRERPEIRIRNPPWAVREDQRFEATLSVDDGWRAVAPVSVGVGSGASQPLYLSIHGDGVQAVARVAAGGRTLTVERAGEKPLSFSLSGVGEMMESLDRCHSRGIALQRRADEDDLRAVDFFVAQQDDEKFAQWSNSLSRLAHAGVTIIGLGDGVCRTVERLSTGRYDLQFANFALGLAITPASKALGTVRKNFADLDVFDPASGDPGIGVVLRTAMERLLVQAETVVHASQALMSAISQGDDAERDRLYAAIARHSHLSYAGDNLYLTIRNASRSEADMEYHLNRASRSINLMNAKLVRSILFLSDDALAERLPALIALSRDRIRDARRWTAGGRKIMTDRLADAMFKQEPEVSRERMALFKAYERSMQAEDALADRFEAALDEVEVAMRRRAPLSDTGYLSLVHGGERTAAALLQERFAHRLERGAAYEALQGR